MISPQCTFEEMMEMSTKMSGLGVAASFFQVEFGLDELRACWDGFTHTSDYYDIEFTSKKQICEKFTDALNDYREYLESPPHEMGSSFH
jgi:hypothetical protein